MTVAIVAQQELVEAIKAHLASASDASWSVVREQFPSISDASFWRYVRKVRSGEAGSQVAKARQCLADQVVMAVSPTRGAPQAKSDGVTPSEHWRNAGVLAQIAQGFNDLELLRRYALRLKPAKSPFYKVQPLIEPFINAVLNRPLTN